MALTRRNTHPHTRCRPIGPECNEPCGLSPRRSTVQDVARTLLQRIHNPHNRACGCDPDCWCQRTAIGRAVKWWFPGRYFGLHHKNRGLAAWKQTAEWKRQNDPEAS
jgi:hypothetical protein